MNEKMCMSSAVQMRVFSKYQNTILNNLTKLLHNRYIVIELSNQITLELIQNPLQDIKIHEWISHNIYARIENYFEDLRMFSYKYALYLTSQEEISEDIAQETVLALLISKTEITYVKGWLKQTTLSLVRKSKHYQAHSVEEKRRLAQEIKIAKQIDEITEENVCEQLNILEIKNLLGRKDYSIYQKLIKYENLTDYAKAEKISYQTAKEHSQIVRRNLKAKYLISQGWDATPEILTYRKYISIRNFLLHLCKVCNSKDISELKKYNIKIPIEELKTLFTNIYELERWGIVLMDLNKYKVSAFGRHDNKPKAIILIISFNKANRITIHSGKELVLLKQTKCTPGFAFPLEKGKIMQCFADRLSEDKSPETIVEELIIKGILPRNYELNHINTNCILSTQKLSKKHTNKKPIK